MSQFKQKSVFPITKPTIFIGKYNNEKNYAEYTKNLKLEE